MSSVSAPTSRNSLGGLAGLPQLAVDLVDRHVELALDTADAAAQIVGERIGMPRRGGLPQWLGPPARRQLFGHKVGEVLHLLNRTQRRAQAAEQCLRLRDIVEQGIQLGDVGADRTHRFLGGGAARRRGLGTSPSCCRLRIRRQIQPAHQPPDRFEMMQNGVDVVPRWRTFAHLAIGCQSLLDRVRAVGDLRLLDDPGGALQRVGEAQQQRHAA